MYVCVWVWVCVFLFARVSTQIFIHILTEYNWVHTFPLVISIMWNADNLVQDLDRVTDSISNDYDRYTTSVSLHGKGETQNQFVFFQRNTIGLNSQGH